jgi:hypothetical protein
MEKSINLKLADYVYHWWEYPDKRLNIKCQITSVENRGGVYHVEVEDGTSYKRFIWKEENVIPYVDYLIPGKEVNIEFNVCNPFYPRRELYELRMVG